DVIDPEEEKIDPGDFLIGRDKAGRSILEIQIKVKRHGKERGSKEFNPEIAAGEFGAADATFAFQEPVAEKGDVVAISNRLVTGAATRTGPPEAFFQRHAVDADIEQAADHGAKEENNGCESERVVQRPAHEIGD